MLLWMNWCVWIIMRNEVMQIVKNDIFQSDRIIMIKIACKPKILTQVSIHINCRLWLSRDGNIYEEIWKVMWNWFPFWWLEIWFSFCFKGEENLPIILGNWKASFSGSRIVRHYNFEKRNERSICLTKFFAKDMVKSMQHHVYKWYTWIIKKYSVDCIFLKCRLIN